MEVGVFLPLSIANLVVYYILSFPSSIKNCGDKQTTQVLLSNLIITSFPALFFWWISEQENSREQGLCQQYAGWILLEIMLYFKKINNLK
jgi:hypothetical protein